MNINKNNLLKLAAAIVISELAGAIGAVFTTSASPAWYAMLVNPAINPPAWVFTPVWTMLYLLIGISLYLAWKNGWKVKNHFLEGERHYGCHGARYRTFGRSARLNDRLAPPVDTQPDSFSKKIRLS